MDAVETIRARAGAAPVALGLVLGSGLGHLADAVEGVAHRLRRAAGLSARRGLGAPAAARRSATSRACGSRCSAGGRTTTSAATPAAMRAPLETLAALGAERLILTNAAGSFRPDIPPGELMLIADHINFSGRNPLIGEPTDARFVNMTDAYDPEMRRALAAAAAAEGVALAEGVYAWYSGPSFETPAEIRALKLLGADAVGMSTVPEVILARFLGLEGRGDLDDHQHGGRHERRGAEPRAHQGDGAARRGQARAGVAPIPRRAALTEAGTDTENWGEYRPRDPVCREGARAGRPVDADLPPHRRGLRQRTAAARHRHDGRAAVGDVRGRRRLHPDAAPVLHRHPAGGRGRLGGEPDRRLVVLRPPRALAAPDRRLQMGLVLLAGGVLGSTRRRADLHAAARDGAVRAGGQPALRGAARHDRRADADREPAGAAPRATTRTRCWRRAGATPGRTACR